MPERFRRVYPGFLQLAGFMSMNLDRHIAAHLDLVEAPRARRPPESRGDAAVL